MIRVAIVEDNEADAQNLALHMEAWRRENEKEMLSCTVYSDAVKFLEQGGAAVDIVFMDIEMPYMNGMDAALEFRKHNQDAILIFATRATKYAVRGYSVDAIGYLVKPISRRAFSDTFEKALRLHRERTKRRTLVLKVKDGMKRISADRILYIESSSHQLEVVTETETFEIWGSLDKMREQLPDSFVACHRGYIVNLEYVDSVGKGGLCIVGKPGLLIPVSRQKRQEFMEALTRYYSQTMRG
ncbi:MAG: LytTR family DNA-binding domain-containing protein [Oscillospiraceae bacterium]|nr:LytTR family DNA-binding domain-containing protein [Oscillospiraceae bacterium]